MTPSSEISLALLISITSIVCTLINTISGTRRQQSQQMELEQKRQTDIEKNFVKINMKLDDFCEHLRELTVENIKKSEQLADVSNRLLIVSERVENLYKTTSDHESRLKRLETRG